MRLFTLIFALYILLLTGIPCCAFDNCEDGHPATAQGNTQHKAPVKEKGCDNCSPFFSCHSCCGFIVQEKMSVTGVHVIYEHLVFTAYRSKYYPEYVPSFWQPPRYC